MYDTINDVITANRELGHHFFDADTKRFFSSRIGNEVYGGCYFITSERSGFAYSSPRRYTVRMAMPNGNIETVGEFCEHETRRDAMRVIKGMITAGYFWPYPSPRKLELQS